MTGTGINNPNWRNREYEEWMANDLSGVPTWDELMAAKAAKELYGEGWEETADKLHAAVELADAQEFLTDSETPADRAYRLEKAMDEDLPAPVIISGGEMLELSNTHNDGDMPF